MGAGNRAVAVFIGTGVTMLLTAALLYLVTGDAEAHSSNAPAVDLAPVAVADTTVVPGPPRATPAHAPTPVDALLQGALPGLPAVSGPRPPTDTDGAVVAGSLVFAPWGSRYRYPGTVVSAEGDRWQVVFEDGDRGTFAEQDLHVGTLAPASEVEAAPLRGRFAAATVLSSRSAGAYQLMFTDRRAWVQVSQIRIPMDARIDTIAHTGTALPEVVIAQYRGRAHWYTASVVRHAGSTQVEVLYDDGTRGRLDPEHIRRGRLHPGQAVQVKVGEDYSTGTIRALAGRAVEVQLAQARQWFPLGALRWSPSQAPF